MLHGVTKQKTTLFILILLSIAAIVTLWLTQSRPPGNFTRSNLLPTTLQKLQWHASPKIIVPITFKGANNQEIDLADFLGTPILLNLWATWCAPCIAEMPALDQLQAAFSNETLAVVALSIDRGGLSDIEPFWKDAKISSLKKYFDTSMNAGQSLGVRGLPTTLLIDREGREVARLEGAAEWANQDTIEYFRKLINNDL